MLSDRQCEEFRERGVVRVDGLIPEAALAPARESFREGLERQGLLRDGVWLLDEPGDWELTSQVLRKLKPRAKSEAFRSLVTEGVLEAAVQLAGGRDLHAVVDRPQILFTPPNAREWTVPHKIWHLDVPRLGEVGLVGVQMFSFLERVAPGGGGTLVVAGSHRLLNDRGRVSSKNVKKLLTREPWFRELFGKRQAERERFLGETVRVDDVDLQVVELCGEPGDVVLTDLRLLHTLAPNASRQPRLMVTQRFYLKSLAAAIYAGEKGAA